MRLKKEAEETKRADIAIVVVTYNSDLEKTIRTLSSIVLQREVSVELVVCDDGSTQNNFSAIRSFFERLDYQIFQLIASNSNVGTVSNCLRGLEVVKSDIVMTLSPGDYLYSSYTLKRIVNAFKQTGADLLFGEAVHYSDDSAFRVYNVRNPIVISPYKSIGKTRTKIMRNMLAFGDYILGAAMVFKSALLKSALQEIMDDVIYCEDFAMQLLLLQGHSLYYLDDYIVWYERGSGISTQKDSPYSLAMRADAIGFYSLVTALYPECKYCQAGLKRSTDIKKGKAQKIFRILLDPSRLLYAMMKRASKRNYKCANYDKAFYNDTLHFASKES